MLSKATSNAINVYSPSPLHLLQFLMFFHPIWNFLLCYSVDTVPWLCVLTIIRLHIFGECVYVYSCACVCAHSILVKVQRQPSMSPLKCPPPLRQDLSQTQNFGTQVRLVSPPASVGLCLGLLSWHCWDYRHLPPRVPPRVPGSAHL